MKSKTCIYFNHLTSKLEVGYDYRKIEFPSFLVKRMPSRGVAHSTLRDSRLLEDILRVLTLERLFDIAKYRHDQQVSIDTFVYRLYSTRLRKLQKRKIHLNPTSPEERIENDYQYSKFLK
jgi:hypothetical protein